jgi:hypothetical protein
MADAINFNGKVEWSGENPGISLKEHPDGPWTNLASFFRVVLSPYGRGHALVLLQSPNEANPPEGRANICYHDNEELARYLVKDFVAHFGAYRGLPRSPTSPIASSTAVSDGRSRVDLYRDRQGGGTTITLTWSGIGEPFCFALPPDKSATGKHHMPSLFVGCKDATIAINGVDAVRQAHSARHGGPLHHDRNARLFRDMDPRLTSEKFRSSAD